jgi:hypothetical protein
MGPGYSSVYFLLNGGGGRAIDNFSQQLFRNLFRLCSQNNYPDVGSNFAQVDFSILQCSKYENLIETVLLCPYIVHPYSR